VDQTGAVFMYLKNKFPRITVAQIKEWVFVGPQIRELIQDAKFKDRVTDVHKGSLEIIQNVTSNFGGHKAENYSGIVVYLLQSYRIMGCNMYLTVHFFWTLT